MSEKTPKRGDLVRLVSTEAVGFVIGWRDRKTFSIQVLPKREEFAVPDALDVAWDPKEVDILVKKEVLEQIEIFLPNFCDLQPTRPS